MGSGKQGRVVGGTYKEDVAVKSVVRHGREVEGPAWAVGSHGRNDCARRRHDHGSPRVAKDRLHRLLLRAGCIVELGVLVEPPRDRERGAHVAALVAPDLGRDLMHGAGEADVVELEADKEQVPAWVKSRGNRLISVGRFDSVERWARLRLEWTGGDLHSWRERKHDRTRS